MGYVFPLVKSIDEVTEVWIDPESWEGLKGMSFLNVSYFTFIPDFLPGFLMKPSLRLEAFLESGRFRSYSARYMVTLEKL